MKNGVYIGELRAYPGSKRRITIMNDRANIYTLGGLFVCQVSPAEIEREYDHFAPVLKSNIHNLAWMRDGAIVEVVVPNASYAVCRHKKAELDKTNRYKGGILVIVESQLS